MIDLCGIRHGRSNIKQLDEDEIIQQDKRQSTDTASVSVKDNTQKKSYEQVRFKLRKPYVFPQKQRGEMIQTKLGNYVKVHVE